MTIFVSRNCVLFHFYVFDPSIEKSTTKMPKLSSSASLTSENRGFKSFSVLSRSDSFSSSSNDSSVYSGSNSPQTRFKKAKSTIQHEINVHKRSRNSSGSSISSNVSGNSDKNLKSSGIISQTLSKTEVNNCISNDVQAPHLNHSRVNSSNEELKEETVVKGKLNSSKNSPVFLPKRHNLRGKITKKGCTCCPSTHTTVVLRHYKKFIHTEEETVISSTKSEGKTVISRTRVKTYVEKSSPNTPENNKQINMSSNGSKTRKRRSEIEKLYASLHEIEWAKNFSPDNILRQINVRQAASCSAFGRSSFNTDDLSEKNSKKQKISKVANNLSCRKSSETMTSKISSEHSESSSCKNISNVDKDMCTVTNCDHSDSEQKISDLQTSEITSSDIYHHKQKYKSCNPHSTVNLTSCSVSRVVKGININSTESLVTENGTDYSDDAQLSYTSDESSSAVSSSIVNLQSKHLLDMKYKNRNRNLSDTDLSEYSTPTFFDIAEEGIRTIDACFREVGAEVVVSTCYDENSLPLLTSVRESKTTIKMSDDPPILEPCVNVEFNCNKKINNPIKVNKKSAIESSFILPVENIGKSKQFDLHHSNCQNGIGSLSFKKSRAFSKLHYRISRKIVKKYMKQTWPTERLKCFPKHKTKLFVDNKNTKLPNRSDRHFKACSDLKVKENNSDISQNSVLLFSTSSKAGVILQICDEESRDKCSTNKVKDGIILDSIKNSSYLCKDEKDIQFPSDAEKQSVVFQTDNRFKQHRSRSISSNVSAEVETQNELKKHIVLQIKNNKSRSVSPILSANVKALSEPKKQSIVLKTDSSNSLSHSRSLSPISAKVENSRICEDRISRPFSSFAFSDEYISITVNRTYDYTHIILKTTRGKSMFLTLETLRELRDAVIRTNNDSSCRVLVINGVGDSFCLGLDLKPLIGPRKKLATTEIAIAIKELFEVLATFKKPIAAVVNGPALGLGMTLLNHADLTIASERATFCMPYSDLGYMPEGGATLTLPQVVGSTVAMDLILRGRILTAHEAKNFGLVHEVLKTSCLPHELVSKIRNLRKSSLCALETTKKLLRLSLHVNLQLILENEVKLLPRMWLTRACQESLRKALETGILSE